MSLTSQNRRTVERLTSAPVPPLKIRTYNSHTRAAPSSDLTFINRDFLVAVGGTVIQDSNMGRANGGRLKKRPSATRAQTNGHSCTFVTAVRGHWYATRGTCFVSRQELKTLIQKRSTGLRSTASLRSQMLEAEVENSIRRANNKNTWRYAPTTTSHPLTNAEVPVERKYRESAAIGSQNDHKFLRINTTEQP